MLLALALLCLATRAAAQASVLLYGMSENLQARRCTPALGMPTCGKQITNKCRDSHRRSPISAQLESIDTATAQPVTGQAAEII